MLFDKEQLIYVTSLFYSAYITMPFTLAISEIAKLWSKLVVMLVLQGIRSIQYFCLYTAREGERGGGRKVREKGTNKRIDMQIINVTTYSTREQGERWSVMSIIKSIGGFNQHTVPLLLIIGLPISTNNQWKFISSLNYSSLTLYAFLTLHCVALSRYSRILWNMCQIEH